MKEKNTAKNCRGRKSNNVKGVRNRKRLLICGIVFVLIISTFVPSFIFNKSSGGLTEIKTHAANKDNVPADTVFNDENDRVRGYYIDGAYELSDINRILDYSRAYYSFPQDHQSDTIRLGYTSGESIGNIADFIAIGTEQHPFKGTVLLVKTSDSTLQIPEAFFDYVYDSVKFIEYEKATSTSGTEINKAMTFERTTTGNEPVIARHVKHDPELTNVNTWKIIINPFNSNNYSTTGFIGEMMSGAMLNLEITDNTTMNIVNNASGENDVKDVGYVCGVMETGSTLNVTDITTSTNTNYSVTSAAGNAGGAVGCMKEGATLSLSCRMPNTSAAVTASGSGKYAGGIVGYNDGGSVVSGKNGSNADVFTSSNKYYIDNTVSGQEGAGGVFGYYRPAFTNGAASFDISWLQVGTDASTRMNANGTGAAGGLFGMLANEIKTTTTETTTYSSGNLTITDGSDNPATIYVDHASGDITDYGGLIGKYTACDISSSLVIENVSVNAARSGGTYVNYGGGIAETAGGNGNANNAVYVKFDDFNATAASGNDTPSKVYGGLVAVSHNSFIDATDVTLSSTSDFYGGGVIGIMDDGVLRLSGTTDLTGGHALVATDHNQGQIVGGRDNSLIFGEYDQTNSCQWKLIRSTVCSVDDIGSWGEVLRFNGIASDIENGVTTTSEKIGGNTVLTVNENDHTVTVASHTVAGGATTISSEADFAKVALCFQIKASENPYLSFSGNWCSSTEIKDVNIDLDSSLATGIDLSDTGLTGFTRDNASSNTEYCVYSGKFNGNNKSITLATGEAYGYRGQNQLSDHSAEGNGKIYRHKYTGLFGIVTGDYDTINYAVKDLTVAGNIDINAQIDAFFCGGYASKATRDFTANNVTTTLDMTNGGDKTLYMGRLVGEMASSIEVIDISGSNFGGTISGTNSDENTCLGGVIGKISHENDQSRSWNFSNVTLEGSIDNTNTKNSQRIGGLIAEIDGSYNANSNHRMLTLDGVTVNGLQVSGSVNSNGTMGGLLGYAWIKTDVDLKNVTVQNKTGADPAVVSTVNIGSAAANTAGLVYRATGRWDITTLNINNIKMTASGANSIGMIINRGYSGADTTFYSSASHSAIYLRLPSTSNYTLAIDSGSSITSTVFDELCAYTCPGESNIMKNGNGIISIYTAGFNTDGLTASGSYHAQTTYGAKPNPNSRYYYNLDALDNEIESSATVDKSGTKLTTDPNTTDPDTTDQKKLMSWGVNVYSCENLKQYFPDKFGSTIPNAIYDMNGFSWYPVTLNSGITLNGTFTLYNKEFEGSEKQKSLAESTNAYWRTSLYDSTNTKNTQHYLMHNALFYNVESSTLTLGTVTLQGSVAGYTKSGSNASICGALVCGTVSGSSTSRVGTVKMTGSGSVTLDGIEVYNDESAVEKATAVSGYAPLLINKLGSHSALNLENVSTTAAYNYDSNNDSTNDSTHLAATSLIGDAGSSSATDINIEFKKITLDARNNTGKSDTNLSVAGNFFGMYNTYNSIFSQATLLNSFSFDSGSSGRYDFEWKEDWDTDNDNAADATHAGHVTYGKELGYDSTNFPKTGTAPNSNYNTQYPDEEFMYSGEDHGAGQGGKYTNPISGSDTTHAYSLADFRANFLPYVFTKYNTTNKTYQLQVNHAAVTSSGCGTYNHPYMIYRGDDIENYCYWINTGLFPNSTVIRIPTAGLEYDAGNITAITGTWCETDNDHVDCTYDQTNSYFTVTVSGTNYTVSPDVMRKYLAGAYYQISETANNNDLRIENAEKFTGFGASDLVEFRFRGVFDGNGKTVTNKTTAPFIYYSNGCVVKDLTVSVEPTADILLVGYRKTFDLMWSSKPNDGDGENAPTGNAAYGAVIARVMGGDTIIDNVNVGFNSMTQKFDLRAKYAQLVPLGGYVGVIVNGGVIFRNMSDAAAAYAVDGLKDSLIAGNANTAYKPTGASSDYVAKSGYTTTGGYLNSNAWLYVNPIIGRVINGFAVTEGDDYLPYEDGSRVYKGGEDDVTKYWDKSQQKEVSAEPENRDHVTLQNGVKHYSIADIDPDGNKVEISGNAVTADDGQAFFIMSLIVNSGMANQSLGYNQQYFVSRSAQYTYVGTETKTDYTDIAEKDSLPSTYISAQFGYLAKAYTDPAANTDDAGVLDNNGDITITLGGDIYLPDGYKGIGNMYSHDENDNYRIKVSDFNGANKTVSINSSWNYYFTDASNNGSLAAFDTAYQHHDHPGFGLFNYQSGETTSALSCYHDFLLTGNVSTECINSASPTGAHVIYKSTNDHSDATGYISSAMNVDNDKMVSAGGLMGMINGSQYLDGVALRNMYVHGIRNAGGLVGLNIAGNTKQFTYRNTEAVGSSEIRVTGAASAGGMIGKSQAAMIDIDNNNASYSITVVESESTSAPVNGKGDWNIGVGAFIGACRAEATNIINISRIVVGSENQPKPSFVKAAYAPIFAGGMIGIINQGTLTITDCTVYNQSVVTKYMAGGLAGYYATPFDAAHISNVKILAKDYDTEHSGIENPKITSENKAAGGFIGALKDEFTKTASSIGQIDIYNSEISGYDISAASTDDDCYAGGAIGLFGHNGSTNYNSYLWNLYNVSVSDCSVNATSTAENKNGYSGGIVGGVAEEGRVGKYKYLYGYNILTKNLDVTGDKCGGVYGKMLNATDCSIKIAGFSRQGTPMIEALAGAPVSGNNIFGTNGYVVFADYNDKASSEGNEKFTNVITSGTNVATQSATHATVSTVTYTIVKNSSGNIVRCTPAYNANPTPNQPNEGVVPGLTPENPTQVTGSGKVLSYSTNTSELTVITNENKGLLTAAGSNGFYLQAQTVRKGKYENIADAEFMYLINTSSKKTYFAIKLNGSPNNNSNASVWYFEDAGNGKYKIYTYETGFEGNSEHKLYLKKDRQNAKLESTGSEFNISYQTRSPIRDNNTIPKTGFEITTDDASNNYFAYSNSNQGFIFDSNGFLNEDNNKANAVLTIYALPVTSSHLQASTYTSGLTYNGTSVAVSGSPASTNTDVAADIAEYNAAIDGLPEGSYTVYTITQTVKKNIYEYDDNKKPFVTTNPRTDISATQFLTSDGAGYLGSTVSYPYSSIGKIMTDVNAGTSPKRYTIAQGAAGADATSALITKLSTYGNLSSYKTEAGAGAGTSYDFPVLIVDEILEDECTSFINTYLRFITNTKFNFASGDSDVFNIEIGSMKWNGSEFVYTSGEYNENTNPNGSYFYNNTANGKFGINGKKFDNTETGRFTLMDVQFYDPGDTSANRKIAYHVYVPILVKKMLQYDFNTAMLSGTNYRTVPYVDSNGNTLIENIGNTVTLLAQWKYRRTIEEWQAALNSGDNLLLALDKQLQLKIHTGIFPSGTEMILVDANNKNKYYRANSDTTGLVSNIAGTNYTFDLSKFSDGTNNFSPVDFNDMLKCTPSVSENADENIFTVVTLDAGATKQNYIDAGATVCIEGVYYKPVTDGAQGTHKITVEYKPGAYADGYLTENYYISFFTDSSATGTDNPELYHLDFYDRGTMNEPSCPTAVLYNSHTHYLTGNIFVNDMDFVANSLNTNYEMSASNNKLYATLKSTLGIQSAMRNDIKAYLSPKNDKVTVYQSLLVMLNKMELTRQQKGILTKPGVNVTNFTVTRENDQGATVATLIADAKAAAALQEDGKEYEELITQNYVELRNNVNLRDYLYNSCLDEYDLTVKAHVELSYTDLGIQFPTRSRENLNNVNIGTILGASSNVSSTNTAAAYSKTASEHWSTTSYYCKTNTNAILTLNSDDSTNKNGEYYQLGVNELDMEADNLHLDANGNSIMKLNALYDVSDLSTADNAKLMVMTISLRKKANYAAELDIDDYITDLVLKDKNGTSFKAEANSTIITVSETADAVEYTYLIKDPRDHLQYDTDSKTYQIPITFTVFSGNNFTGQYSNYMINLNVKLYDDYTVSNATYLDGSNDDDHVIWTNAKIVYNVF